MTGLATCAAVAAAAVAVAENDGVFDGDSDRVHFDVDMLDVNGAVVGDVVAAEKANSIADLSDREADTAMAAESQDGWAIVAAAGEILEWAMSV